MEKTATEFRYEDYFDLRIEDAHKRQQVIDELEWLATQTGGEGLAKIEKARELHGRITVLEGEETASNYFVGSLIVNFYQLHNARYEDEEGNLHTISLRRGLVHEIGHLADENTVKYYTPERIAEINKIEAENLKQAQEELPQENEKREQRLTQAVANPEAFSRSEAMEIMKDVQQVWKSDIFLEARQVELFFKSAAYQEKLALLEEPVTNFENGIMHRYGGEPPRKDYQATKFAFGYKDILSSNFYQYIDGKPFPVNPEPAMGATCGIPGDILEKINRGEMTLAQAGVTLDPDETLPDEQEGCLVVASWTPPPPEAEIKEPKR